MEGTKKLRKPNKTHNTYHNLGKNSFGNKDEGYQIRYRAELRRKALNAYSNGNPKCLCCGFNIPEYLELDHIEGGGTKERVIANNSMIWWVVRNNFPAGFQILCSLCNRSKKHRSECVYHKYMPKFCEK